VPHRRFVIGDRLLSLPGSFPDMSTSGVRTSIIRIESQSHVEVRQSAIEFVLVRVYPPSIPIRLPVLRIAGNRPIDIEHLPIKVGLRGRITGLRRHVAGSDIFSLGRRAALPSSGKPFFDALYDT
jgi:hypothetical protein